MKQEEFKKNISQIILLLDGFAANFDDPDAPEKTLVANSKGLLEQIQEDGANAGDCLGLFKKEIIPIVVTVIKFSARSLLMKSCEIQKLYESIFSYLSEKEKEEIIKISEDALYNKQFSCSKRRWQYLVELSGVVSQFSNVQQTELAQKMTVLLDYIKFIEAERTFNPSMLQDRINHVMYAMGSIVAQVNSANSLALESIKEIYKLTEKLGFDGDQAFYFVMQGYCAKVNRDLNRDLQIKSTEIYSAASIYAVTILRKLTVDCGFSLSFTHSALLAMNSFGLDVKQINFNEPVLVTMLATAMQIYMEDLIEKQQKSRRNCYASKFQQIVGAEDKSDLSQNAMRGLVEFLVNCLKQLNRTQEFNKSAAISFAEIATQILLSQQGLDAPREMLTFSINT